MFADWLLALRVLREASGGQIQRALYLDLDVHQGDGVSRDKLEANDVDLVILDVYNADVRERLAASLLIPSAMHAALIIFAMLHRDRRSILALKFRFPSVV